MQEVQELDAIEISDTSGGMNWVDSLFNAMNAAERVMYELTHPD